MEEILNANQISFGFYNGFSTYKRLSEPKISIYKPFKVILSVLGNIIEIIANNAMIITMDSLLFDLPFYCTSLFSTEIVLLHIFTKLHLKLILFFIY